MDATDHLEATSSLPSLPSFAAAVAAEYPDVRPGHLDTATAGLPPARTAAAMRSAVDAWAAGRPCHDLFEDAVAAARAGYARLAGVPVERVALAGTVAGAVGLIAAQLPPGAEVLLAEGDFSALIQPFAGRTDLRVRYVPLTGLADAVRPGTALVAVSTVQSSDGRIADLDAIRAAAAAAGARVLLDATQSVGWLPLDASRYDYVVAHSYKWLLGVHGAGFLTVAEGAEHTLSPAFAGWYAAQEPMDACYGPVERLAAGARRFDTRPAYLSYVAVAASLSFLLELGGPAVHAHDVALADRLRDGLRRAGYRPVDSPSAIVAVPGVPESVAARLPAAGIRCASRNGNLRFALHVHNTPADVSAALAALGA